jgi:hypothetical protein
MHLPSKQLRIATLGTLFTMSSSVVLASFAGAAGAAPAKDKPEPKAHHHGHVHIDKGAKKAQLYKDCQVRIRPHKYDKGATPTFAITASPKKPSPYVQGVNELPIAITTSNNGAPTTPYGTDVSFKGQQPEYVSLNELGRQDTPGTWSVATPHGKMHPNGKNDLHWHVRITVTQTDEAAGKKHTWHKDVRVFGCGVAAKGADPALDTETDAPDDTNIPADVDDNDADVPVVSCDAAFFGTPLPSAKPNLNAGQLLAVTYIGDEDLEAGQLVATVDGAPVSLMEDPQADVTNYWYLTPLNMSNGKHTLSVQATDSSGICGQQTVTFIVNNGGSGTT